MAKFEIGEIAVLIYSKNHPERVGEECEIIGIDVESTTKDSRGYAVQYKSIPGHHISGHWIAKEAQLRKKKPPKEELSTWEEIQKLTDWKPEEVTA